MESPRERKDVRASADRSARRRRVRALLVGAIVATLLGFGAGWLARMWADRYRTPEQRAHERVGEVQRRVHDLTH